MRRLASWVPLALTVVWGATLGVRAEDVKGRWHIGGGTSFVSTTDDIRSNAAFVLFLQPGQDGIPDTGDEAILFADPRPDDTLSRETTINEGLKFDFNFSYGVTDWMSLQVDAGYFDSDIVQFDTWVTQREFMDFNRDGILGQTEVEEFTQSQPITAGSITQIPLSLTAVFRFRKDSPLNPYIGLGFGYIFTDAQASSELGEINATLNTQQIRTVGTNNFFPDFEVCSAGSINDCPPFKDYTLDVEDSTEWHLSGGAEYFFNSNFSIYFDARYMFANSELVLRSGAFNQDQLHFTFNAVSDTLPFCGDETLFIPPGDPGSIFPANFSTTDQGLPNICRPGDPPLSPTDPENRLVDEILVQGGKIGLTNFTIGIGLRWYF